MDESLDPFEFAGHAPWPCSSDEYHASPALSGSALKRYIGIAPPKTDDAPREGTAIHTFSIEPQHEDAIVKRPPVDMSGPRAPRKKGCVEARAQWVAEWEEQHALPGQVVLSPEQYERARRRAAALSKFEISPGLPLSRLILRRDVLVEKSMRFQVYGLEGKRRPDVEMPGYFLLDVKSTSEATVDGFRRAVAKLAYDLSLSWNVDSGRPVHGWPNKVGFLAVNEEAEVAWFEVPESVLSLGSTRYRTALRLARVHRESGQEPPSHWSFGGHVLPDPTPWDRAEIESLASYSEKVEEWHNNKSRRETQAAAQ